MARRTGKELAGIAVVTLTGGERLGRIQDVVFFGKTGRITGFLVDSGGLFAKPRFLPAGHVQTLGSDALTVSGPDVLVERNPAQNDPDEWEAKVVEGRPVLNEAGTILGKVADVIVDDDLTVPGLLLATGFLENTLHGRPRLPCTLIQTIGKDSLVVSNAYDPKAPEFHRAPS